MIKSQKTHRTDEVFREWYQKTVLKIENAGLMARLVNCVGLSKTTVFKRKKNNKCTFA